jgi:hypothetical protein
VIFLYKIIKGTVVFAGGGQVWDFASPAENFYIFVYSSKLVERNRMVYRTLPNHDPYIQCYSLKVWSSACPLPPQTDRTVPNKIRSIFGIVIGLLMKV